MRQISALIPVLLLAAAACSTSSRDTELMSPTTSTASAVSDPPSDSPFLAKSPLPYGTPAFDKIRDEHFLPAFTEGMQQHLAEVQAITHQSAAPTFENTIEALERAGTMLARVNSVFFNLTSSNTNPTLQKVQVEMAPKLASHQDSIHLDGRLFARIDAVYAARDQLADAEKKRLVERYHLAFIRSGARLDDQAKQRMRAINEEHSTLTTLFQNRLLADTAALAVVVDSEAELAGLDASAISAAADAAKAAGHEGKFLITLQLPTSQGILSSLQHRWTRQRVFEASIARCSRGDQNDTQELVLRLAQLRSGRANLLGYDSYAAYVLEDQMAGTPEAVETMVTSLVPTIVSKTNAEAAELQAHLDKTQPGIRLAPYDWAFVSEQVRKERFAFDEAEVKQYFEMERVVQDGLFLMGRKLYGIELRERPDLPVYHEDVRVFEVFDEDGSAIGLFYLDLYARPGKRGGAWMSSFVRQSELLAQKPVVLNVMNISKPGKGQPTLLTFDEVTTLFHEFGHGVHGLFSQVRYPMLSGTSVPRDFVEFPSQFHEDFVFDPAVLAACARHWETGEPMPQELLAKVRSARTFGQGFASFEYIAATLLDMAWHTLPAGSEIKDVATFEAEALRRAGVANDLVPPRYRSTYFAHVWPGGYSAAYYAYLWSEALAADAFEGAKENGGLTAANGTRLRETVLSRGMTREPMQMFKDFRGRALDTKALLVRRGLQ